MKAMMKLSPGATTVIRMDHTSVIATFHKYRLDASASTREALMNTICLALEVHAQLEEEIFYPAMRGIDSKTVAKSIPEHDDMKRLIAKLRRMQADDARYDRTAMELMRDVLHHVADEETILLPEAERMFSASELDELGVQMTKRRLELAAPRAGELAVNAARTHPAAVMAAAAGMLVVGALLARRNGAGSGGSARDAGGS